MSQLKDWKRVPTCSKACCQLMIIHLPEKKETLAKALNIKHNPTIFFGKKETSNERQNELA